MKSNGWDNKETTSWYCGWDFGKILPAANNYVVDLLESEGAEAVCPDMLDFFMYSAVDSVFKADHLGFKKSSKQIGKAAVWLLENFRKPMKKALKESKRFVLHRAFIHWKIMQLHSFQPVTRPVKDGS